MKKIFFALLLLTGCTQSPDLDRADVAPDGAVELELRIPDSSLASTRAIADTQENTVVEVDVLVFKIDGTNETFVYNTYGLLKSGQGTATQVYGAALQVQSYPQRVVVITNARKDVSALTGSSVWTGASKASMLSRLRYSIESNKDRWTANSSTDFRPIPMWGESGAETITPATTKLASVIPMMRALARVDVKVDATATSQFKLKSVDFYNTNTQGRLVPDAAKVTEEQRNGQRYLYVTATSIPDEAQPYSARHLGPITYTDFASPGTPDVAMIGAIYTPEADVMSTDSQVAALVVGGLYGTDTSVTYYRVDFRATAHGARLPLLRNHQYVINVTSITGRGHTTKQEAFSSKSVNITADIMVWNQAGTDNVVTDGTYTLRSSKDIIQLYRGAYTGASASGDNTLTVRTTVPAGWSVASITDAGGAPISWLNISPTTGATATDVAAYLTATNNDSGASRTGIITLAAGRLRYPIKVTQLSTYAPVALKISPTGAETTDTAELDFVAAVNVAPTPLSFQVDWQPVASTVTVASAQAAGADAAFAGANAPVAETLPSGSTPRKYTSIAPPAITTAEYTANPFIVKASKVDYTVNSPDGGTLTKSIVLKQYVPGIVVAPATFYTVDGRSYSLNVRSNAKWIVKSVTESTAAPYAAFKTTSILNNKPTDNLRVGTTGGPNTTAGGGDPLTFTTTTQVGRYGVITVVIGSADPAAPFADRTLTLVMAAPPIKMFGLSGTAGGEGGTKYNLITLPGGLNTPADGSTMLTTTANFGLTAASKVQTSMIPAAQYGWYRVDNSGGGNYTVVASDIQRASDYSADFFWIGGDLQWGDDISLQIKQQFLDKGRTVFVSVQDNATIWSMLHVCLGTKTTENWLSTGTVYPNNDGAVYQFNNTLDPVLVGPFGDLRQQYWGMHWTGTNVFWINNSSSNDVLVQLSNGTNQSGSTNVNGDPSWGFTAFRGKNTNLVMVFDDGHVVSDTANGTNVSPFFIDPTTKAPSTKQYGTGTLRPVSNSAFIANVVAWAVARNPKN